MRKLGIFCIILGFMCLLASAGWYVYNRQDAKNAEDAAQTLLQDVQAQIVEAEAADVSEEVPDEQAAAVQTGGYDCVGVLSLPVLELELPVLSDWTYEKLKVAPCVYYGTHGEKNFVIAAHNYEGHFKRLSQLQPGDLIFFTDMSGGEYIYEVVLLETLPGDATKAMITADFDLSLYTCTPGGASRVTVRCSAIENGIPQSTD